MPAPQPPDEAARLKALRSLSILDTPAEPAYDDLIALASFICGVPISFIGLMDHDRLWFKARRGLPEPEAPRDLAFCGYTILQNDIFIVPDAESDPRSRAIHW